MESFLSRSPLYSKERERALWGVYPTGDSHGEGESSAVPLKIRAPGIAGHSSAKPNRTAAIPSPVRLCLWLRRDRVEAQRRRTGEDIAANDF